MKRLERKARLIRLLAEYLSGEPARRSIELEMGKPDAQQWAQMYNAAGVIGYATVEETERLLTELIG